MELDISENLVTNAVKFLHAVMDQIPARLNIAKSFYASKFRILEERGNVYLPASKSKSQTRCMRCCLPISDSPITVRPQLKKSKFAEKLLKKIEKSRKLTTYQQEYCNKLNQQHVNSLVVTCNFCKKEKVSFLAKPRKEVPQVVKVTRVSATSSRKKKKKPDKFSGLNQEAVGSAQVKKSNNLFSIFRTPDYSLLSNAPCPKITAKTSSKTKKSLKKNENRPTLNNTVSNKNKMTKFQRQNMNKLNRVLNHANKNNSSRNGLTQFLQTFN